MAKRSARGAPKAAGGAPSKGSAISRGTASTLPNRQLPANKKPGGSRGLLNLKSENSSFFGKFNFDLHALACVLAWKVQV
ncbi:hypothetical protein ENH_00086310 [Eimeria necatrix]|uniref:Uncharacterized protein n=1 Tax=Eimeria necatrix TaxID=51315 RepID=U6MXR9_9EIME|nr:hypothetical protein ENH_00086310 [Eimeria necatrix]CDJ66495.1 hypothetical protein ENH_00086310 [Eimeria necatrix]